MIVQQKKFKSKANIWHNESVLTQFELTLVGVLAVYTYIYYIDDRWEPRHFQNLADGKREIPHRRFPSPSNQETVSE
ncbi:hypothetical protein C7T94_17655 [Pedobacter yulinensis]|uniref:Uncharacterized protein n=1 Tax=Pedobacter yulinensis TaxID=2126353 RepID=A0A2T3HHV0_9SPHI|nr:hypothetical protein C7T94_17655 [Pedobacter yulinensis]